MYDYPVSDAIYEIPLQEIHASDDFNCRDIFTVASVRGLCESIKELGKLIEPIIVQPMEDVPQSERVSSKKWRVVAGHRRFKAVQLIPWNTIASRIVTGLTAIEAARLNLLENIERENLNIMEEARSLEKVWKDADEKELSKKIKRPVKWIRVRRLLVELPEEIQQAAASGRLSQYDIEFIGSAEERRRVTVAEQILAKKAGKQVSSPRAKNKVYKKSKQRSGQEIRQMLVHIMELSKIHKWDASQVASTLAWVLGNISTKELLEKRLPLHHDEHIFDD